MVKQSDDYSENLIPEWLVEIVKSDGGNKDDVEDVGDKNKGIPGKKQSPPDYVFPFKKRRIAVEAVRLVPKNTHKKWTAAVKNLERQINNLTREIARDNGTYPWYFVCEYDPHYPPPRKFKDIKEQAMKAFREGKQWYNYQLLPDDKKRGYGMKLELVHHVKHEGTPGEVTSGTGFLVEENLKKELQNMIRRKEDKVTDEVKTEYEGYLWWLVLDDRILRATKEALDPKEVENVEEHVRSLINKDLWDKVVLVSPWKQVWAIWENPDSAKLPPDLVW